MHPFQYPFPTVPERDSECSIQFCYLLKQIPFAKDEAKARYHMIGYIFHRTFHVFVKSEEPRLIFQRKNIKIKNNFIMINILKNFSVWDRVAVFCPLIHFISIQLLFRLGFHLTKDFSSLNDSSSSI